MCVVSGLVYLVRVIAFGELSAFSIDQYGSNCRTHDLGSLPQAPHGGFAPDKHASCYRAAANHHRRISNAELGAALTVPLWWGISTRTC